MTATPLLDEIAADSGDDVGLAYVDELRRPRDEVLEVHGHGDLELYERLLQDDQVYPTFHQRRAAVIAREWIVEPGGDSALDVAAADSLRDQLQHLSWDRATYRMLTGLMYGFGVAEAIYEPDGLRVRLAGLRVRRSRRFRFGREGELRLERAGRFDVMPERKFWTMTVGAESDDDPYGRGLGHWLYWPVWFKRNAIRFWSVFLEKFAMGIPIARVPPGTGKDEQLRILALLDAIQAGGKIVLPSSVPLELLQSAKDSGGDYERFVERMDKAIAKIVLTQTMTTDDGSSLAQAQVHERMANAVNKTDADILCESFMVGPASWLTEWNYPGAATPRVYRDFAASHDLKAIADRDAVINTLGWRPSAERIRETYGDGYEPAPAPAPGAMPAAFAELLQDERAATAFARAYKAAHNGTTLFAEPLRDANDAVRDLLTDWRKLLGPEVERIEHLLEDCRTLEEVRDRLGELATSQPDLLADSLGRMMFAANVAGQLENDGGPNG
jgi:phage gp29-like protein